MPDLSFETELLAAGAARVAGVDEVGRGAIAGPVAVGIAVIDAQCTEIPKGLADSKELSAKQRETLKPIVCEWVCEVAVGYASAEEIDDIGIMAALRLAGERAVAQCAPFDAYIIDGPRDWLQLSEVTGHPRVKADRDCASVSAASVVAKVERDAMMAALAEQFPGYGWEGNKGYGAAAHLEAIATQGACVQHRRSWSLFHPQGDEASTADETLF